MDLISEVSELSMQKATSEMLMLHPPKNKIVEGSFSADGTWQRRGYFSMNGCVTALSVVIGKEVDIEIMSSPAERFLKCLEELSRKLLQQITWFIEIFKAHYFGNGDSKGFISVKGICEKDRVTKYKSIGHVQKTIDARLCTLKSISKNLSGKGKLTDSFIDRLKNYYGIASCNNVGNLPGIQQNVIAVLFHCSFRFEKLMHGQCPIVKCSWCYYQRTMSCGKKPKEKYKGLSKEALNMIKHTCDVPPWGEHLSEYQRELEVYD
ncbi:uncharacterized protein TNCV_1759771 [Trichonephila clavipes]|nr:uncharacterized protein TNCV_1759771 [Trichonephila clavipes]